MNYSSNAENQRLNFPLTDLLPFPKRLSINPPDFTQVQKPRFEYGSILRWIPTDGETDWGIVIGRFYSYVPHASNWQWYYLLWLDKACKSAAWCQFDVAWEEDLEPVSH